MYVEAVGHAADHQFARLVDDLDLDVVHASVHFLYLDARAAHFPRLAVEIHANPVAALQARVQRQSNVQDSLYVPQGFFRAWGRNGQALILEWPCIFCGFVGR